MFRASRQVSEIKRDVRVSKLRIGRTGFHDFNARVFVVEVSNWFVSSSRNRDRRTARHDYANNVYYVIFLFLFSSPGVLCKFPRNIVSCKCGLFARTRVNSSKFILVSSSTIHLKICLTCKCYANHRRDLL